MMSDKLIAILRTDRVTEVTYRLATSQQALFRMREDEFDFKDHEFFLMMNALQHINEVHIFAVPNDNWSDFFKRPELRTELVALLHQMQLSFNKNSGIFYVPPLLTVLPKGGAIDDWITWKEEALLYDLCVAMDTQDKASAMLWSLRPSSHSLRYPIPWCTEISQTVVADVLAQ